MGPSSVFFVGGGNPNLKPEQSKAWSLGLVYTSELFSRTRLSIDYTRIEKSDEIRELFADQILANESSLPGRITRGANLPGDLPGWAGPIVGFDASLLNVAHSEVEAVDVQIDSEKEFSNAGKIVFQAAVTWQTHFKQQLAPSTPMLENVGYLGGPLKLRANASLAWESTHWTIGWSARYFGPNKVYVAGASVSTIAINTLNQGADSIPSQTYHDVFAELKLNGLATNRRSTMVANAMANTVITFGVRNVFIRGSWLSRIR